MAEYRGSGQGAASQGWAVPGGLTPRSGGRDVAQERGPGSLQGRGVGDSRAGGDSRGQTALRGSGKGGSRGQTVPRDAGVRVPAELRTDGVVDVGGALGVLPPLPLVLLGREIRRLQ